MDQVVDANGTTTRSVNPLPQDVLSAADDKFDAAAQGDTAAVPAVPEPATPAASPAAAEPVVKAQEVGSTPPAEAKTTAETSPEWTNLLAKYKGDQNAAAKAYWETNNRASQLAKERDELAEKLKAVQAPGSTPAPQAQPTPVAQLVPELQRYEQKILSVEKTYLAKHKEHETYSTARATVKQQIAGLRRQLASNDISLDRDKLTADLMGALAQEDGIEQYLLSLENDMTSIDERWQELQMNQETVKRTLALERAAQEDREAKAQAQEQQQTEAFRTEWFGTIDRISKDATLVPAKHAERFVKLVKQAGMAHVAAGTPIENTEAFIKEQAAEFRSTLEAERQEAVAAYSQQKIQDSTLQAPTGKTALAPETKSPRKDWTRKDWDAHEENIVL